MLDTDLIRRNVLMISDAGELAGGVIQSIIAEAERYAREEGSRESVHKRIKNIQEVQEAKRILQGLLEEIRK